MSDFTTALHDDPHPKPIVKPRPNVLREVGIAFEEFADRFFRAARKELTRNDVALVN